MLPPLAMSTGFVMFLSPEFRVPWSWAAGAFVLGALVLSYPLLRTSRLAPATLYSRMLAGRAAAA